MTFGTLGDLAWPAILVAAIAYVAIGAAWYAPPVFGRIWMDAGGARTGSPSSNGSGGAAAQTPGGPALYAVPFVGALVSCLAIGMLAAATGTDTGNEGLALGLVVGIGFAAPVSLATAAFETKRPRRFVWGGVNAGYHLLGSVVAALIVALWG